MSVFAVIAMFPTELRKKKKKKKRRRVGLPLRFRASRYKNKAIDR